MIADIGTLFFYACENFMWSYQKRLRLIVHLSRKLEKNIVNWLTLTGKQKERNTRKKLSRTYHLIMSIFSLFDFVA